MDRAFLRNDAAQFLPEFRRNICSEQFHDAPFLRRLYYPHRGSQRG
jgi:hypothetical protein